MKKQTLISLLVFVLLFTLLSGGVSAEDAAGSYSTGEVNGLGSFSLSVTPSEDPVRAEIADDPIMITNGTVTVKYGQFGKDYEYIIKVPANTTEVTITYNLVNSIYSGSERPGFFIEKENNSVLQFADANKANVPTDDTAVTSTTVKLENGTGLSPRIVPYVHSTQTGNYTYSHMPSGKYMSIYRFRFVAEQGIADIKTNLPERAEYTVGATTVEPLQIEVNKPADSTIAYAWYRGTTPETVTELIAGENDATYTPVVSVAGVTYYRVKATVTTADNQKIELPSNATKFVVKNQNVNFGLSDIWGKKLEVKSTSSKIYQVVLGASVLDKIQGKLSGTIPDGETITRIWSGSGANNYNLTGTDAVSVDYDTNTFTVDLSKAVSEADSKYFNITSTGRPQQHRRGCSLYLECSDGSVCTLILDSSYVRSNLDNAPVVVQLVDATGEPLPDFQVTDLRSTNTSSSVYTGTISSDTPVVLCAQTYDDRATLVGGLIRDTVSAVSYWTEARSTWVLVNGEMVGGKSYGGTSDHPAESSAFTLKPGLNVVEVYTNALPYYFSDKRSANPGLSNSLTIAVSGTYYTYEPALETDCVVYLIDYQGEASQNVPKDDMSDTTLADITAIRYGDKAQTFAECPAEWKDGVYEITLPAVFKTEKPDVTSYTHVLLLNAKPKTPGATAAISSNTSGLILGESVSNTAFMDAEALKDTEDASFAITVTAADGKTQKTYPAKIIFASSATEPEITVEGPKLDVEFDESTYAYYLQYANKTAGKMTITLPDGASATVNGDHITNGDEITLDSTKDFYRLTITAADNFTTTSYYFVTKYADGTIPYTTISDNSKKLVKELLSGWYNSLSSMKYAASYWNIFMAAATDNQDGTPFDFNGVYVEDPARHGMKQSTDWAACIMEIVMLGRNPYDFPRYENGVLNEHYNYVEGLIKTGGGAWGNNVWYHMATKAAGAPQIMLYSMKQDAMKPTYNLDIRGWTIASLAGCVETKDMVRYIDGLHNVQDTSGKFASLWTDNSWHGGSSGNTYTIGCVLSAIASAGVDPDKQFALDGRTPLETIKETLYREDGKFISEGVPDGIIPKDMIIGLGDILHGSNVWARYTLTADKYDSLIAKAKTLNVNTSSMPETFTQTTACGKAYYDLYDAVYAALVAAGRTAEAKEMRPDVIWGMPYEAFADEVNKMPAASALTADDLAKLEELIKQYEAMDDSNRKAVASDVLTKYQALVKRGLALKAESTTADSDKISKIYDEILALPAASEITESNIEATLAKVTEIEQEIGTLSEEEKSLLTWMDNSLLQKLEDIKKAAPKPDITVTFTLLGDIHHTITDDSNIHSYRFNAGPVWVEETTVTVAEGSTVGDVFKQVLDKNGLKYTGLDNGYIDSITYTDNTTLTAKDDNRDKSGWLYLVQPKDGKATHPNVGLNAYELSDGDKIIWHWSDDYQIEQGSEHWSASRVVDYVANLYDLAEMEQDAAAKAELEKKADAAYGVLGSEDELLPLQSQVKTLCAIRKSVRDVTALIKGITDWTVPAGYSNERDDVVTWVQDKLNTELADQLAGVSVTASIGVYDITPSKSGVDGKFTATIYLSKEVTADSGDKLSSKNEQTIKGVLKASAAQSSDTGVSSVTVCNTLATASEDGSTYTVTVPYGSTVTAESFTITLSSSTANYSVPTETESGVWTFTVTAENDTTADYTVKVLVAADPAEGNKAAVDAAKAMLEKADFIYASKDVNTEAAAKAAVERQIGALLRDTDISCEVTMTGFTAAVDGTLWSEPTNGSFSFTVKLTKGENDSYAEANVSLTGTITAASKPVTPVEPSKPTKPSTPTKPDTSKDNLPFTDVVSGSWYYDGVKYACDNGLMNGTSANAFSPNADTTRSMIVTILARMEGVNTSGGATWYARGREWAMENGISDGTNIEGKITREQLAAMLYRYAKMKGYDVSASASLSGYTDASSVSGWAKEAMQWAVGSGLIQGSGNALTPQANASRAQIATILMRFAQNIAK